MLDPLIWQDQNCIFSNNGNKKKLTYGTLVNYLSNLPKCNTRTKASNQAVCWVITTVTETGRPPCSGCKIGRREGLSRTDVHGIWLIPLWIFSIVIRWRRIHFFFFRFEEKWWKLVYEKVVYDNIHITWSWSPRYCCQCLTKTLKACSLIKI